MHHSYEEQTSRKLDQVSIEIIDLRNLIRSLLNNSQIPLKPFFTMEELAEYLGLSCSTLYKWTSSKKISYYQPSGKVIFFKKTEIDAWLFKNKIKSKENVQEDVESHLRYLN